jgi:thioredoxin reductase (NADPH)
VFLFLGADPSTEWLESCDVAVDNRGFVTTGNDLTLPLQTSVPGVFAIGDVRAGSVKRVGGAIGEGAAVVLQIHAYLARQQAKAEAASLPLPQVSQDLVRAPTPAQTAPTNP